MSLRNHISTTFKGNFGFLLAKALQDCYLCTPKSWGKAQTLWQVAERNHWLHRRRASQVVLTEISLVPQRAR